MWCFWRRSCRAAGRSLAFVRPQASNSGLSVPSRSWFCSLRSMTWSGLFPKTATVSSCFWPKPSTGTTTVRPIARNLWWQLVSTTWPFASNDILVTLSVRAHYMKGAGCYERDSMVEACCRHPLTDGQREANRRKWGGEGDGADRLINLVYNMSRYDQIIGINILQD